MGLHLGGGLTRAGGAAAGAVAGGMVTGGGKGMVGEMGRGAGVNFGNCGNVVPCGLVLPAPRDRVRTTTEPVCELVSMFVELGLE